MKLTNKETATVLAALRFWQMENSRRDVNLVKAENVGFFDECEPLTTKEIDELCTDINSSRRAK
jgi:hypothetical protein